MYIHVLSWQLSEEQACEHLPPVESLRWAMLSQSPGRFWQKLEWNASKNVWRIKGTGWDATWFMWKTHGLSLPRLYVNCSIIFNAEKWILMNFEYFKCLNCFADLWCQAHSQQGANMSNLYQTTVFFVIGFLSLLCHSPAGENPLKSGRSWWQSGPVQLSGPQRSIKDP